MLEWLIPPILIGAAALIPDKRLSKWEYKPKYIYPESWLVPIGKDRKVIYHHFDEYPHLLIGGTTRFGKTVLLKSIFTSLLLANPDKVNFIIIDLKGKLEFWKYRDLPQVFAVAGDIVEAAMILDKVYREIKNAQKYFLRNEWTNITDTPIKRRTFIIVDEGAELSPRLVHKDLRKYAELCMIYLGEIARIGGGLGFRLIYATQYPTKEAVPMQVKMNMVARIAFKIPDTVGSKVILDETGANELKPIPGRAIYKLAESLEIQCPYIDDEMMGVLFRELRKGRNGVVYD